MAMEWKRQGSRFVNATVYRDTRPVVQTLSCQGQFPGRALWRGVRFHRQSVRRLQAGVDNLDNLVHYLGVAHRCCNLSEFRLMVEAGR